ncbi:MAG TPA: hypothetical protein VFV19_17160 [Candidatus Polarisedimenticolaceae bacterium]|nr:hypothetical protein [Candidatus Polarisedimenticolaceae bacterium]
MERKKAIWLVLGSVVIAVAAFVAVTATPAQAFINCRFVSCAAPACEDNQHLQVPPGQCCPVCVNN